MRDFECINTDVCYICKGDLPESPWCIFIDANTTAPVCDICEKNNVKPGYTSNNKEKQIIKKTEKPNDTHKH